MSNPLRQPGPALPGLALFSTIRLLTPPLQVTLLRDGYATSILNSLGFWRVTPGPLVTGLKGSLGGLGGLGTYLERPGGCLVFGTWIGVLKHMYWSIFTPNAGFPILPALGISLYNLTIDVINSLVLAYRLAYHPSGNGILTKSDWKQFLGLSLVILGTGMEIVSEEGRRRWKVKKSGKGKGKEGKVYDQGLFGVVRHPNYLGYVLWRTGLALTTGSTWNAIIQLTWNLGFFIFGSVPELQGYMQKEYGEGYQAYEKKVPYKLIPYIY